MSDICVGIEIRGTCKRSGHPHPSFAPIWEEQPEEVTFRFILNYSKATAPNVYLMLYPKPPLASVLKNDPDIAKDVWKALSSLTAEMLTGEGRVYGGGLHKLEPKELANVSADPVLKVLSDRNGFRMYTQLALFG